MASRRRRRCRGSGSVDGIASLEVAAVVWRTGGRERGDLAAMGLAGLDGRAGWSLPRVQSGWLA